MNFELLNNLMREYIFIVEALRGKASDKVIDKEDRLYLDRENFDILLSKNLFLPLDEKKKIWRNLGWISCDKDVSRYTKKLWIDGKSFRKITIEIKPYLAIKNLISR